MVLYSQMTRGTFEAREDPSEDGAIADSSVQRSLTISRSMQSPFPSFRRAYEPPISFPKCLDGPTDIRRTHVWTMHAHECAMASGKGCLVQRGPSLLIIAHRLLSSVASASALGCHPRGASSSQDISLPHRLLGRHKSLDTNVCCLR